MLAAIGLALPSMRVGMWNAEWCTLELCSGSFSECTARWWEDQSPPGYYIGIWSWFRFVNPGAVSVRLPSLIAHLAALALMYEYCRRYHGENTARLATWGLAVNATMVWFATCGRCFALYVPLTLSLIWAYRAGRSCLFTANAVLLVWLHYAMVPLLGLVWLWDVATTRKLTGPATRALAVAALACSPLVAHLFGDRIKAFERYREFDLATAFLTAKWWFGLDCLPPAAMVLAISLLALALLHQARHCALETWLAAASLGSAATVSAFVYPAFHPKFLLWTLPLSQICVASLLSGRLRVLGWLWIGIAAVGSWQAAGLERSSDLQDAAVLAARFARHDRVFTANLAAPAPHWRLEETLRVLPRTGTGPPSTWLIQGKPEDRHEFCVVHRPGVAATPPTSWTLLGPATVLLEPVPSRPAGSIESGRSTTPP